jgi:hypothetical protein
MIRAEQKRAALCVMLAAWRSYGDRAFKVARFGDHWKPLHDAEQLGWCSFIGDRCRLERLGVEQLIPFGVKVEAELQAMAEVRA